MNDSALRRIEWLLTKVTGAEPGKQDPARHLPQPYGEAEAALGRAVGDLRPAIDYSAALSTHDPLPRVLADPTPLARLFQNLLGKALEFRRPGEPPRVHVSVRRSGADWVFSVRDNGIGIAPEHFERIFGVFQRLQPALRELIREELEDVGYKICEAGSGAEAQAVVQRHDGDIHLMLTDVVLPGMSGRDLAGRLALSCPDMKVLYMSGYTEDAIVHRGALGAGTAFIAKPFTPDTLVRKVRAVLDEPVVP